MPQRPDLNESKMSKSYTLLQVKLWTTINEPNQYCMYFNMLFAISGIVNASDVNIHRCMHNTILAHMKVYRLYKEKYYTSQGGKQRQEPHSDLDRAVS